MSCPNIAVFDLLSKDAINQSTSQIDRVLDDVLGHKPEHKPEAPALPEGFVCNDHDGLS